MGEGDVDRAGEVSRGGRKREAASLWARAVDPLAEVVVPPASPHAFASTTKLQGNKVVAVCTICYEQAFS